MRYASITNRLTGLGSGKWAVHIEARHMIHEGVPVIELTIGEPDVVPDRRLLDECARAMYAGRTRYSNGRGEPAVVNALVEKYQKRRADVTAENVLCFPGTQTALFAVMLGLVEAGDVVLTGDPLYATYEGVVASTGATLKTVPLHPERRFHLQADDLEAAIAPETRVLLLNNPHNPSGAVLSREEIAAIGAVCRKHDLWIVCDEVYEQLIFEKQFFSPFDDPALAERVIAVSSISKSHAAPGFRSGWAVGPAEFCERLLPVSETMLFGGRADVLDLGVHRRGGLGHDRDGAVAAFRYSRGDEGQLLPARQDRRRRAQGLERDHPADAGRRHVHSARRLRHRPVRRGFRLETAPEQARGRDAGLVLRGRGQRFRPSVADSAR